MRRVAILGASTALAAFALLIVRRLWRSRSAKKLDDLTKDELYERAREADVPGRSQMTKPELVDVLKDE